MELDGTESSHLTALSNLQPDSNERSLEKSLVCLKFPPCVSMQKESMRDLDSAPIAPTRGLVHGAQANTAQTE